MTATANATDLPEGSVVAEGKRVYLKTYRDSDLPWNDFDGGSMYVNYASDEEVGELLDEGAAVLRRGYGGRMPDRSPVVAGRPTPDVSVRRFVAERMIRLRLGTR